MVDCFQNVSNWIKRCREKYACQTIRYVCGDVGEVTIEQVTVKQHTYGVRDANGIYLRVEGWPFQICKTLLVIDEDLHEPKPGDEIFWNGGKFRVSAMGDLGTHHEFGRYRQDWVVYTKKDKRP